MSSKDKDLETPPDVRAIERQLKRGLMTKKEHEKLLKNLPDVRSKGIMLSELPPPAPVARPVIAPPVITAIMPPASASSDDDLDDLDDDDDDDDDLEAAGDGEGEGDDEDEDDEKEEDDSGDSSQD